MDEHADFSDPRPAPIRPDYTPMTAPGVVRPLRPGEQRDRAPSRRRDRQARDPRALRRELEEAVEEANAEAERRQDPLRYALKERDGSLVLEIRKEGRTVEETLRTEEIPQWIARLHHRLGLLVDQRV